MVKKILTFIACFAVMLTALTADFRLTSPFSVDDFEEGPSNVIAAVYSSNLNLVPSTNLFVSGNGQFRLLSVTPRVNTYGESVINVELCDHGYSAIRSAEMLTTPGVLSSNVFTNGFPFYVTNKTLTGQARVELTWNEPQYTKTTNSPFLIHRSTTPLAQITGNIATLYKTIGSTFGTSFTDTNVVVGTNYYYLVTYWGTGPGYDVQCTNYQFTLKVKPDVKLIFVGDGFGFEGKAGKTYRIMTKNNLTNDVNWQKILDVDVTSDHFFIFKGQEYLNKPIHVRELD